MSIFAQSFYQTPGDFQEPKHIHYRQRWRCREQAIKSQCVYFLNLKRKELEPVIYIQEIKISFFALPHRNWSTELLLSDKLNFIPFEARLIKLKLKSWVWIVVYGDNSGDTQKNDAFGADSN